MPEKDLAQAHPESAHAQAVDPENQALQSARVTEPPYEEQLRAAGQDPTGAPQTRLEEVLPQIKDLAQKVGGMHQLAEIIKSLEQAKG